MGKERAVAAYVLGLEREASAEAVRAAYAEKVAPVQARLEGAPTEGLKEKYRAELRRLREARDLLLSPPAGSVASPLSASRQHDLPLAQPDYEADAYRGVERPRSSVPAHTGPAPSQRQMGLRRWFGTCLAAIGKRGYSSKEIADRVREAKRSNWSQLSLSRCGVQEGDLQRLLTEPGVEGLRRLDLESNRLVSLPFEMGRFTALTELYLSDNQLSARLPVIGRLTALTKLSLSQNQLTALPSEIGDLPRLEALWISQNKLTALPLEIGFLSRLEILWLSENQLTALPQQICRLPALRQLDLRGNRIAALPPEIGCLTALRVLNLSDNQLTTLPPEIGGLTKLTSLFLEGNRLSRLPPEISCLTALHQLALQRNPLPERIIDEAAEDTEAAKTFIGGFNPMKKSIEEQYSSWEFATYVARARSSGWEELNVFFRNVQDSDLRELLEEPGVEGLRRLDLNRTGLSAIPPAIGRLTALTRLSLNQNRISSLPPEIGQLTALTELDLHENQLTALPAEIGRLTALEKLNLQGNRLTTLPAEIGQLTALTKATITWNRLTTLPQEIGGLTSLRTLELYNNQLSTLPAEIGQLTALTELSLIGNQLSTLPPEVGRLTSLTWLDLRGNPLPAGLLEAAAEGAQAALAHLRGDR